MRPLSRKALACIFVMLCVPILPGTAAAAEATVILSEDCDYLLLDSANGQMIVKLIKGERPQAGDRLEGEFAPRKATQLKVVRTGAIINVWVDLIDRSASKAIMRFSQYCS